jgi:N-methylhydantoinase A
MRVGVDIGGTFTDLVCFDPATGQYRYEKILSTPNQPQRAVFAAIDSTQVDHSAIDVLVHGSTVAINAVIQRSGANTALVTTAGFKDLYEIGRNNRPNAYDLGFVRPQPLVDASRRWEVAERVLVDGSVMLAPNLEDLEPIARGLQEQAVQAVAVCFLHAYQNPKHEQMVGAWLAKRLPGVYITLSSDLTREYREYERFSTAVLNAYVGPEVTRYVKVLDEQLKESGFKGELTLMQSNGGGMSPEEAYTIPVAMMESGPAGGIQGAAYLGRLMGIKDLIAFDMGGTTAKACLVENGVPKMTSQYFVGGYQHGFPMRMPVVDIIEVGTGGGSLAWLDEAGAVKVGPRSAGASPGPACYGLGGTRPTVTDANLLTGRLRADGFLGGRMTLDASVASEALSRELADSLKMSVSQTAAGVIKLADEQMANAVRAVSLQRGHDPRRFAMVAFGGAGPLHALSIARALRIPKVLIPPHPGHFSALGMLTIDARRDLIRTRIVDLVPAELQNIRQTLNSLMEDAKRYDEQRKHINRKSRLLLSCDIRYLGQEYTVEVPLAGVPRSNSDITAIRHAFDREYQLRYGHAAADGTAQVVNWRCAWVQSVDKPDLAQREVAGPGQTKVNPKTREVFFFDLGWTACQIRSRESLRVGEVIVGPAVIEEHASSTVLQRGDRLCVDKTGTLIIEVNNNQKGESV